MERHDTRGITLVEVTIVTALAMLVILSMIGFYISSQSSWTDGSTQALVQRDATLLLGTMSSNIRGASSAEVQDWPDADHQALILRDASATETGCFWWNASDSLIYRGPGVGTGGRAVVPSRVRRLQLSVADTSLVEINLLEMPTTGGTLIRLRSAAALYNR